MNNNEITDLTELDIKNNNGEYKVEAICDSAVYTRKLESSQLLKLYYLIFWKSYPEKKISRSLFLPFDNLENSLASFIRIILTS